MRAAALAAVAAAGVIGWRIGRAEPLARGVVMVDAADLDVLLGHFYDEVTGSPDRSHWTFPLLRQAADRLADASWPPGAPRHPAMPPPVRPADDQRDET